jgi:hypothetical protein
MRMAARMLAAVATRWVSRCQNAVPRIGLVRTEGQALLSR